MEQTRIVTLPHPLLWTIKYSTLTSILRSITYSICTDTSFRLGCPRASQTRLEVKCSSRVKSTQLTLASSACGGKPPNSEERSSKEFERNDQIAMLNWLYRNSFVECILSIGWITCFLDKFNQETCQYLPQGIQSPCFTRRSNSFHGSRFLCWITRNGSKYHPSISMSEAHLHLRMIEVLRHLRCP